MHKKLLQIDIWKEFFAGISELNEIRLNESRGEPFCNFCSTNRNSYLKSLRQACHTCEEPYHYPNKYRHGE